MPAGRYKHRVQIEKNEPTKDEQTRQRVDVWVFWFRRRASIKPARAREVFFEDAKRQQLITHTIRMRSDSRTREITPKHRIRFGTRIFEIEGVTYPDERGIELEIQAIEVEQP